MRPSSVIAHLAITHGRPAPSSFKYGALSRRASSSSTPTSVSMPMLASSANPRPATSGNGSRIAATTRRMPASRIAATQGGVLPKWRQGSSVTKSVAPGRARAGRAGPRPRHAVRQTGRGRPRSQGRAHRRSRSPPWDSARRSLGHAGRAPRPGACACGRKSNRRAWRGGFSDKSSGSAGRGEQRAAPNSSGQRQERRGAGHYSTQPSEVTAMPRVSRLRRAA